jgi:hypothetical protein
VAFPHNAKDLKELIWVADNALRQAKREGRDRAVLERRKSIRVNPMPGTRIELVGLSGKENVKAPKIANISNEGMLLILSQDIPDKEFFCHIYCPTGGASFKLTCEVKHQGKSESGPYCIGVYFPDIPESIKGKLSSCIKLPEEL